ncbi:GPI biosynthesis protein family Pig-F [Zalerion maritima]|uniref:GPI biosynthesis protein family Pig-F n=1 Tax=Zalerion maritima TaxID=339359 RepID=A0AAD5WR84_9PEZI|nr:GPI biosynthesis protein family Pig-F [Zalerion maritima]
MAVLDPSSMYGAAAQAPANPTTATGKPGQAVDVQPVIPLATPAANVFRHVQPVVLVSLLVLRFKALVADPTAELFNGLPLVAAIQVAYVLLCLPAAGSEQITKKKTKPGEKKRKEEKVISGVLTAMFSLLLTLTTVLPLHVGFILFGAPLDNYVFETALVSAHTGLLALFPVFYTRGVDADSWVALAGLNTPVDEVMGGAIGCLVGAWLGAVPIPLDWDRDWQRWPVTIVVGMWLGGVVGKGIGGLVVKKTPASG